MRDRFKRAPRRAWVASILMALCVAACTRRAGDVIRITPLSVPATAIITATVPAPTATSSVQMKPNVPTVDPAKRLNANIYLVALEDNGKRGRKIGCNDSLLPRTVIVDSDKPIAGALTELFAARSADAGLYTALAQSSLRVEGTDNSNGRVIVKLRGEFKLGGMCDNARVAEQIRETVTQFGWSKNAEILFNGAPLEQAVK